MIGSLPVVSSITPPYYTGRRTKGQNILRFRKKTRCGYLFGCISDYYLDHLTSLKSSQRELCLFDRSSCLIFQFLVIPEEPNLTLSSRMLKLILSMVFIRKRC